MFTVFKRLLSNSECPDCGWFIACDKCSERLDHVDEDIDKVEQHKKEFPDSIV